VNAKAIHCEHGKREEQAPTELGNPRGILKAAKHKLRLAPPYHRPLRFLLSLSKKKRER